jgi:hypothetical protein
LQRVDHVLDEQKAVAEGEQFLVALDPGGARDRGDRALLERLRDEAVRVCERRGREAVPPVVFGREGEEEVAGRGRARVNRKAIYFLVKEPLRGLGGGAHQNFRFGCLHSVSSSRRGRSAARTRRGRAGPQV